MNTHLLTVSDEMLKEIQKLIEEKQTTKPSTDSKSVFISDSERREIERLIAKNITTAQDLISILHRMVTVDIDGLQVSLEPRLLERLKTRCIGMPFEQFLHTTIRKLLREYAGLG